MFASLLLFPAAAQPAPSLASVSPARTRFDSGPTTVTLQGAFFSGAGPVSVLFGGVPATEVVIVDDTTITCAAPAADPGPVDVEVINANGQAILTRGFSYTPAVHSDGVFQPGGTATFRLLNTPDDVILVFFGHGSPVSVTIPGVFGTLCLAEPVPWMVIPFWAPAEFHWGAAVPNDPGLIGFSILVQVATGSRRPEVPAFANCVPVSIQ